MNSAAAANANAPGKIEITDEPGPLGVMRPFSPRLATRAGLSVSVSVESITGAPRMRRRQFLVEFDLSVRRRWRESAP